MVSFCIRNKPSLLNHHHYYYYYYYYYLRSIIWLSIIIIWLSIIIIWLSIICPRLLLFSTPSFPLYGAFAHDYYKTPSFPLYEGIKEKMESNNNRAQIAYYEIHQGLKEK